MNILSKWKVVLSIESIFNKNKEKKLLPEEKRKLYVYTTEYQVREENAEIMKWWSMVVATELAQIDKDIKVGSSFEEKFSNFRNSFLLGEHYSCSSRG